MKRIIVFLLVLFASKLMAQDYNIDYVKDSNIHRLTFTLNQWCVKPTKISEKKYEIIDFESANYIEQRAGQEFHL